ncbi:MAG: hypothetical protein Q8R76_03830 [Candidatus Omnitrophota bacterium]|nr:hypothetical protein [Candidatus Omnitrophota bacterium]
MKKIPFIFLILVLSSGPVYAGRSIPYRQASSPYFRETAAYWTSTKPGYAQRAAAGVQHGFKNMLLGWTNIFTEPMIQQARGENVLIGAANGIRKAVVSTVGGAVEGISAPFVAAITDN